jgi:hypothetical protein
MSEVRCQRAEVGNRKSEVGSQALFQILVEPRDRSIHSIDLVLRLHKKMPFAGIHDELRRHTERPQSVPEFVGLRRGALGITLTDDDQGGGLHVLDVMNRRTFLINCGVVVNR